MKKLSALLIMLLLILCAIQSVAFAEEPFLIEDIQLKLSPTVAPNRLLLSFNISESIDLSQENTDIIIEYLGENLETTNYIKNRLWSGYLNSYENYPSGEQKYSSGYANENYPDLVPATKIYTVTITGVKIDIAKVSAVKITVLRSDGSGEQMTVDIDGNILGFEVVESSVIEEVEPPPYEAGPPETEQSLGIKIDSETVTLPPNTVLVAEELSGGSVYNVVSSLMADAVNFIAFDIKLDSNGQTIQPDGKVKISIPIPEGFNSSNLAVYRIDNDGNKIPYAMTVTTNGATEYATFLTEHFSTYVLAEERPPQAQKDNNQNQSAQLSGVRRRPAMENEIAENNPLETTEIEENRIPLAGEMAETEENKTPMTGRDQSQNYYSAIIVIIGLLIFINIKKTSRT